MSQVLRVEEILRLLGGLGERMLYPCPGSQDWCTLGRCSVLFLLKFGLAHMGNPGGQANQELEAVWNMTTHDTER